MLLSPADTTRLLLWSDNAVNARTASTAARCGGDGIRTRDVFLAKEVLWPD